MNGGERVTRYGYAIRTGGDPEIAAALGKGIDQGTRRALKTQSSDAVRRVAMMRHTPEEWAEMTEEARVIYGGRKVLPRWAERLRAGWGLICWGVSRAYHAQEKLLGNG